MAFAVVRYHLTLVCAFGFGLYTVISLQSPLKAQWNKNLLSSSSTAVSTPSPRRSGHAGFIVDNVPYIFGGYSEEDDPSGKDGDATFMRHPINDLWKWSGSSGGGWTSVSPSGDIPRKRLAAAAASPFSNTDSDIANAAYLFGGWDSGKKGSGGDILDSVHKFDAEANTWTELTGCTLPDGPTSRHVAVSLPNYQDTILLHTHRCMDHVILFDAAKEEFRKQGTRGVCPSSRGLHAAVALGDNKVVVFGGAAQSGSMSNEAFVLNTRTWEWRVLQPLADMGEIPCERAGPCLVAYNDTAVLLFGGAQATPEGLKPLNDLWMLNCDIDGKNDDVEACIWHKILIGSNDGTVPPPRNAATLLECDSIVKDSKQFILTGGWAPFRTTWDDCFVLQIS